MIRKPELVHKVCRKIEEFLISCAEYFTSTFGADRCTAFSGGPIESNKLIGL